MEKASKRRRSLRRCLCFEGALSGPFAGELEDIRMVSPLARDVHFCRRWGRRKEEDSLSNFSTPPRRSSEGAPRKTPGFFFLFALLPLHSLQPPSLPLFNTPPFKHPKTAIPQASRRRFQLRRLRWPFTQLQQQPPFLLLLLNQQPQLPTGSGRLEGRRRERARRRRRGESSREGRPRLAREGSRREVPAPRLGPASGLVPGLSASAQGRAGTVYGRERSF